jgi:hypothetical protein
LSVVSSASVSSASRSARFLLAALAGLANVQLDQGVLLQILAPDHVKQAASLCGLNLLM